MLVQNQSVSLLRKWIVPSSSGLTRRSSQYYVFMQYSIRSFQPATYIMASQKHGTIYVWVTSDLVKRVYEHKHHIFEWFTNQYAITNLVYFECHETMDTAIAREKTLKKWNREWKTRLIEEQNPEWRDLYDDII
jgi:putative endonuclease